MKILTEGEKQIVDYIENNNDYLKEFHNIYYNKYEKYLGDYYTADYVITKKISANKIDRYNNYDEFIGQYLLQLHEDLIEAEDIYIAYYEAFEENMGQELQQLQERYNKAFDDLYMAYQIKTIWQFYSGFLIEKLIGYYVDGYSLYKVVEHTEKYKRYLDNRYAVDMELEGAEGLIGIQSKSITYLKINDCKKDVHIKKHSDYKEKYKSETYYILSYNYKPYYYNDTTGRKVYLIRSEEVKKLKLEGLKEGTYKELAVSMEVNTNE